MGSNYAANISLGKDVVAIKKSAGSHSATNFSVGNHVASDSCCLVCMVLL